MVNFNKLVKLKAEANKNIDRDKSLPKIVPHKELNQVLEIELKYINENTSQPRKEYDETKLKELADSIEQKGLIQPIVVSEQGNRLFIIIAGHRRFRAYKLLGRTSIPCVVDIFSTNQDDLSEKALVENLQRENLKASEIAETIHRLRQKEKDIDALTKITGYKKSSIFSYQKAYQNILEGKLTPEVLNKWGIRNINLKSKSPTVGLEENIDSPKLKIAKKNSKSFKKIMITDTEKLEELEQAQKALENQLTIVKRLIKKLANNGG